MVMAPPIERRTTITAYLNTDPRVVRARQALDAFNTSPAGQLLDAATRGPDWRVKLATLDPDIKDRGEAHYHNWHQTRRLVLRELIESEARDGRE